jgi:trans-aconitate 2-methyltransferase
LKRSNSYFMTTTTKEVENYYNNYVSHQKKIGVSNRHRIIFKNLLKLGLRKESNVLEIGCGIGTVSSLIIKSIPKGFFVGVDISSESIAIAKSFNPHKNVSFIVSDMSDFHSNAVFDFVVFPDVLEHIPVKDHKILFEKVAAVCSPKAKVLINIPEPNALNWTRTHTPEKLQIIDQSLSMQELINTVYPCGFHVQSIEPYSIHTNVPNYLKIVLLRDPSVPSLKYNGKFSKLLQNLKIRLL